MEAALTTYEAKTGVRAVQTSMNHAQDINAESSDQQRQKG
jgi:hypothetical protein